MIHSVAWKALIALGIAVAAKALRRIPPLPRPVVGVRGVARARAMEASLLFAAVEPVLRQIAAWIVALGARPPPRLVARLQRSGTWLGLSAEEAIALGLVLATCGTLAAGWGARMLGGSALWCVVGFGVGMVLPALRMLDAEKSRRRDATRELPGAIDLLSLCMSAGLDFPAALRLAISDDAVGTVLREGLRLALCELELGRTRVEALRSLEARLPFPAIQGFVAAVRQSEERGNPLADVIRIQAEVLRTERGVLAEEAASRAAVLLVFPLMLLMGSVVLLLFGPFIVGGFLR